MKNTDYIPALPMQASGLPDALAAANSHTDAMLTTQQTVEIANKIAHLRSLDAPIRALAVQIVGNMRHAKTEAPFRIASWIRENVRYTQETPLVEVLQGPYRTLGNNVRVQTPMGPFEFRGTGTGDCDDLSILFACLCRSIGIEAFLAGIARKDRPESFFHAMGYSNGNFYELSLDAPYGGVGGANIVSSAPYPNIVATIFDPVRNFRKVIKPDKEQVSMSGMYGTGMGGSDCACGCAGSGNCGYMSGYMGSTNEIPPLTPNANGVMPVDSLQPRYTVPFNLYAPSRQISGISMNGTSRGSHGAHGGSLDAGGSSLGDTPLLSISQDYNRRVGMKASRAAVVAVLFRFLQTNDAGPSHAGQYKIDVVGAYDGTEESVLQQLQAAVAQQSVAPVTIPALRMSNVSIPTVTTKQVYPLYGYFVARQGRGGVDFAFPLPMSVTFSGQIALKPLTSLVSHDPYLQVGTFRFDKLPGGFAGGALALGKEIIKVIKALPSGNSAYAHSGEFMPRDLQQLAFNALNSTLAPAAGRAQQQANVGLPESDTGWGTLITATPARTADVGGIVGTGVRRFAQPVAQQPVVSDSVPLPEPSVSVPPVSEPVPAKGGGGLLAVLGGAAALYFIAKG